MISPEVTPIKVDEIKPEVFNSYKERLARKLMKYNFHSEVIANNTDLKTAIENYVIENVIDAMNKNTILGISKKLANMEIALPNGSRVTFPIIHTYKYHNLISTTIFYMDEENHFKAEEIELNPSSLIIT